MTSKEDIIRTIDHLVIKYSPPIDDYDAGIVEGLRLARAEVFTYNDRSWNEIHKETEYAEFRVK